MKTTLLINQAQNTATLLLAPENMIEREVFAELRRRGVRFEAMVDGEPAREDDRPTKPPETPRAMPQESVQDMALQTLENIQGVFDARRLRDAMMARFPHRRSKIVTGVYMAIRRLQLLGKIQIVPGGYQIVPSAPAPVMTAAAETVAQ